MRGTGFNPSSLDDIPSRQPPFLVETAFEFFARTRRPCLQALLWVSQIRRSASKTGRHTRIGLRKDLLMLARNVALHLKAGLHLGSKSRTAAKAEATGYARSFRRAFD
jgi:hypothetical protein